MLLALFLRGFAKADAGATAVLIDEFDASQFKSAPTGPVCRRPDEFNERVDLTNVVLEIAQNLRRWNTK
jgi:hypothetical protein